MASSTQTVVEGDSVERLPSPVNGPVTGEERAGALERDGHTLSWPDVINKATEINLNIGGLQASFRIGVVILLVLVLCIVSIARWPTSSSPTGSQPSDAPTLDLSDISPVNVSMAEDTENPHTTVSLENKNSTEADSSETPSAQALSTFSPVIAGFSEGEVSQVLEKAIQGLRYPTDQNETIEELQALNRELILKAHQQAVEETVQTLKKKVLRFVAWVCVAVAIADPVLLVFFVSIRAMLRFYWYPDIYTVGIESDIYIPGIEEDESDYSSLHHSRRPSLNPGLLRPPSPELSRTASPGPPFVKMFNPALPPAELQHPVSPELPPPASSEPRHVVSRRYTVRSAFGSISWPFVVRILSQSTYLGSAIYFLSKEQRTAGDVTIIAGCGLSLLLSALSHTSAASTFWHNVARNIALRVGSKIRRSYNELDLVCSRGVSRLPYMMDLFYSIGRTEPQGRFTS